MKKILIVALFLSLVLNIYLMFFSNHEDVSSQVQSPVKEEPVNQDISNQSGRTDNAALLEAKIKELEKTVADISAKSKADQARIKDLEDLLASKDVANKASEPKTVSAKPNKLDKEEVEKMKAEKEDLIEQFEAEKVDPSWAYKVQDDITDMIHESDLLLSMSFNGIECKTTKCRVSITPNEQGMGHKITAFFEVSSQLRETEYSKFVTTSDNMGDESEAVYIYLSRPDSEG